MLKGKRLHAVWTSVMVLGAVIAVGSTPASASYRVRPGDTVYEIAKRHHVSVESIQRANSLNDHTILGIGDKLVIPGEVRSSTSAKKVVSPRRETTLRMRRIQQARNSTRSSSRIARDCKPWYEDSAQEQTAGGDSSVIRTAFAYKGTPYSFGGTSRGGFDCSGFTRYVYAKHGVPLPHSSSSQFSHGISVSKDELQKGDLVFFHTNRSGISHVGIYVGDGKFIHASNVRRGVTVDSLHSSYYSARYRGT